MANDFGFAIWVVDLGKFFHYMDGDFGLSIDCYCFVFFDTFLFFYYFCIFFFFFCNFGLIIYMGLIYIHTLASGHVHTRVLRGFSTFWINFNNLHPL